jgi:hypothetical protein
MAPASQVKPSLAGSAPSAIARLPIHIVLVALGTRAVADTDVWGHMRFGLDLVATRNLPAFDTYSFTSTQPWVNHEWLSDVLFAVAYESGGLPMLAALRASSIVLALLILNHGLRDVRLPLRDLFIAVGVLVALPLLGTIRPQIFSIPLYALTLVALTRDAVWLPIVFAIWANLHGGWLLGFGAVVARTIFSATRRRILIMASCALATLMTPFGIALWWALGDAVGRGWADVAEWQPVWRVAYGGVDLFAWIGVAALVGWAAYRRLPAAAWEWVWTLSVGIAAARARRHVPFFAVTTLLLLLRHVEARLRPSTRSTVAVADGQRTGQAFLILAIPIAAALYVAFQVVRPTVTCLPEAQPTRRPDVAAVRFVREADIQGRVLTWFDWGLYTIWHLGDRVKVSYDNRRETVYSAQLVADHQRFYSGGAPDYPDRLRADYVWLPPDLPPVAQLTSRGWHVVFRGPRSVILGREFRPAVFNESAPVRPSCFPDP